MPPADQPTQNAALESSHRSYETNVDQGERRSGTSSTKQENIPSTSGGISSMLKNNTETGDLDIAARPSRPRGNAVFQPLVPFRPSSSRLSERTSDNLARRHFGAHRADLVLGSSHGEPSKGRIARDKPQNFSKPIRPRPGEPQDHGSRTNFRPQRPLQSVGLFPNQRVHGSTRSVPGHSAVARTRSPPAYYGRIPGQWPRSPSPNSPPGTAISTSSSQLIGPTVDSGSSTLLLHKPVPRRFGQGPGIQVYDTNTDPPIQPYTGAESALFGKPESASISGEGMGMTDAPAPKKTTPPLYYDYSEGFEHPPSHNIHEIRSSPPPYLKKLNQGSIDGGSDGSQTDVSDSASRLSLAAELALHGSATLSYINQDSPVNPGAQLSSPKSINIEDIRTVTGSTNVAEYPPSLIVESDTSLTRSLQRHLSISDPIEKVLPQALSIGEREAVGKVAEAPRHTPSLESCSISPSRLQHSSYLMRPSQHPARSRRKANYTSDWGKFSPPSSSRSTELEKSVYDMTPSTMERTADGELYEEHGVLSINRHNSTDNSSESVNQNCIGQDQSTSTTPDAEDAEEHGILSGYIHEGKGDTPSSDQQYILSVDQQRSSAEAAANPCQVSAEERLPRFHSLAAMSAANPIHSVHKVEVAEQYENLHPKGTDGHAAMTQTVVTSDEIGEYGTLASESSVRAAEYNRQLTTVRPTSRPQTSSTSDTDNARVRMLKQSFPWLVSGVPSIPGGSSITPTPPPVNHPHGQIPIASMENVAKPNQPHSRYPVPLGNDTENETLTADRYGCLGGPRRFRLKLRRSSLVDPEDPCSDREQPAQMKLKVAKVYYDGKAKRVHKRDSSTSGTSPVEQTGSSGCFYFRRIHEDTPSVTDLLVSRPTLPQVTRNRRRHLRLSQARRIPSALPTPNPADGAIAVGETRSHFSDDSSIVADTRRRRLRKRLSAKLRTWGVGKNPTADHDSQQYLTVGRQLADAPEPDSTVSLDSRFLSVLRDLAELARTRVRKAKQRLHQKYTAYKPDLAPVPEERHF